MSSHYTPPEMFLFTDTKIKQELNTQNINMKPTEKHVISMVVDGREAFFVQPRNSNQWVRRARGTSSPGLTKGQLAEV